MQLMEEQEKLELAYEAALSEVRPYAPVVSCEPDLTPAYSQLNEYKRRCGEVVPDEPVRMFRSTSARCVH